MKRLSFTTATAAQPLARRRQTQAVIQALEPRRLLAATYSSQPSPIGAHAAQTNLQIDNAPPTIASLSLSSANPIRGQRLNVVASRVRDLDSAVNSVAFWDDDGDLVFDGANDQFLGNGVKVPGGWKLSPGPNTLELALGQHIICAQATDNDAATSNVVSRTLTVCNAVPRISRLALRVTRNPDTGAALRTLLACGVRDADGPDGQPASVSVWEDVNKNRRFDESIDMRVGDMQFDNQTHICSFDLPSARRGVHRYLVRAVDSPDGGLALKAISIIIPSQSINLLSLSASSRVLYPHLLSSTTGTGTEADPYLNPDGTGGIQTCIDALKADRGGLVLLAGGYFQISQSIVIDSPGITLRGVSGGFMREVWRDPTSSGITAEREGITATKIKIASNAPADTAAITVGRYDEAPGHTVRASQVTIEDIYFDGVDHTLANRTCIKHVGDATGGHHSGSDHLTLRRLYARQFNKVLWVQSGELDAAQIQQCEFTSNQDVFTNKESSNTLLAYVHITECQIDDNYGKPISFSGNVIGLMVSGCTILRNGGGGVNLMGAYCSLFGNVIQDNAGDSVVWGCQRSLISSNVIRTPSSYYDLRITGIYNTVTENAATSLYGDSTNSKGLLVSGDDNTINVPRLIRSVDGSDAWGVTDTGRRNVINGTSKNSGDPDFAGAWNGEVKPDGITIRDTVNGISYFYHSAIDGGRLSIPDVNVEYVQGLEDGGLSGLGPPPVDGDPVNTQVQSGGSITINSAPYDSGLFYAWGIKRGKAYSAALLSGAAGSGPLANNTLVVHKMDYPTTLRAGDELYLLYVDADVSAPPKAIGRVTDTSTDTFTFTTSTNLTWLPSPQEVAIDGALRLASTSHRGTATLSGGQVLIKTSAITAESIVLIADQGGNITNLGSHFEERSSRVVATSFLIKSTNALDASDLAWIIIEP